MNDSLPTSTRCSQIRTLTLWRPSAFRGPSACLDPHVSRAAEPSYIAYLGEFGHVGAYGGRRDDENAWPIFGLGGIMLPSGNVEGFASYLEFLKRRLSAFDGATRKTPRYAVEHPQVQRAICRLLNRLVTEGGMVFWVAVEKRTSTKAHDPKQLYHATLRETIAGLDRFCLSRGSLLTIVLDVKSEECFDSSAYADAFDSFLDAACDGRASVPPIAMQNQLTALQCATWICTLIGPARCYAVAPVEYPECGSVVKYFGGRLEAASLMNLIRRACP